MPVVPVRRDEVPAAGERPAGVGLGRKRLERFAGRFSLVRSLGKGGMGEVTLALDHTSGTECALKRLSLHLPDAARDTLKREFEVLTRLRHPAIVAVHEFGFSAEGRAWITMDYVPGRNADEAVRGQGFDAVLEVAAQVVDGLESLHGAGFVHGDLKPSNVIVVPGGTHGSSPALVKLVDFGLSALIERDHEGHRGTPGYAAPEVVLGAPLSKASDHYSLGITLCVLASEACGAREGEHTVEIPRDAAAASLKLADLNVPTPFREAVLRLLALEAAQRPNSLASLREVIERLQGRAGHALGSLLRSEQAVGRAREWVRLERWLAPDGPHRLLLVEGGPGSGKSTLIRAVAARATLAGHPVISIAAAAGAGSGELARRLLLRLAAAAEANGRLTPEITAVRERLEHGALRPDEDLMALADAGLRWAAGSAESRPLVVLLDDIDQADARSLAVVRRMSSAAPPETRWLWASGAGWVGEGSPEALLAQTGWAERLPLGALAAGESRALIEARLRAVPPPALADFIWERCGGHPGMTVDALHRLADAGVLALTEAGVQFDRAALSNVAFPADFVAACLERLYHSDPETIRAAQILAVWDAPLDPAALSRIGVEQTGRVVSGLQTAGLLGRDDDGRVSLNPPALRPVLRETLGPEARAVIGRAALALPDVTAEQRFRLWVAIGDPARALEEAELAFAERADHGLAIEAARVAAEAGLEAREAAWHGRAGRILFDHGRLREAVGHLETALEKGADDPDRERWIMELSVSLMRLSRHDALREFNRRALAEPVGPVCRVQLLITSAGSHMDQREADLFRAGLAEAQRLAEECGDPEALGLVGLSRAYEQLRGHADGGRAMEFARTALAHFRSIGDTRNELRVTCALCSAMWQAQRGEEALPLLAEAIERARARDLRLILIELLGVRIQILVQGGDWRSAVPVQEEYVRLSIEEGLRFFTTIGVIWFSLLLALIGEHQAALRLARRGIGLARTNIPGLLMTAHRALSLAARNGGRARLSARAYHRALQHRVANTDATAHGWLRLEFGQLLAWRGRWQRALDVWDSLLREHPEPDVLEYVLTYLQSARACLRLEPLRADAVRRRQRVEAWFERQAQPLALAHRAQFDAEAHLIEGRVEATIETARECLAAFDRFPSPAESAHAALAFARLALESPIAPRLPIMEWLEHALAGFQRLGDRVGRVDALERMYDLQRRFGAVPRKPLRDRELLQRVGGLIESMSDFEQLAKAAMRLAVDELDAERGVLLLAPGDSDDEADLEAVVEHGAIDAETRGDALGYSRKAVRITRETGQPLVIQDAATELEGRSRSVVELGVRSILCVPLMHEGRLIGAVYLDDRRRSQAFGRIEKDQLVSFAELLAVAIQRSRGHDATQRENEQLLGENLALRRAASQRLHPGNFIGSSLAMQRTLAIVERAARSERTVLITGENGTGKELIAQMIHHSGPRAGKPFIAVNCGAIGGDLIVSELFGIEDKVATGVDRRLGFFRAANGGTLFLDEIGEMSQAGQVALLRVLAERAVQPVGSSKVVPVDVRVIAATNRDLPEQIESGAFRRDLFFRLNVIPVEVPPLRERRADIPSLAQHFVARIAAAESREVPQLSPALLEALMQSSWPGNVRELENYIERLMTLQSERVLEPDPLPSDLQKRAAAGPARRQARTLREMVEELERRQVGEALERNAWHQSRAAAELGITEQAMRYRIKKFGFLNPRH